MPNPVATGQSLTYTIDISNAGPLPAAAVALDDPLPPNTTFVFCSVSQGSCAGPPVGTNGTVTSSLGAIGPAGSATVTIVVNVTAISGMLSNTATVSSSTFDPNLDNNADTAVTALAVSNIPTLSPWMLGLLGLTLVGMALLLIARNP